MAAVAIATPPTFSDLAKELGYDAEMEQFAPDEERSKLLDFVESLYVVSHM